MRKAVYEVFQHEKYLMTGTIELIQRKLGLTEGQIRRLKRSGDKGFLIQTVGTAVSECVLTRPGYKDEIGSVDEIAMATGLRRKTLFGYKGNSPKSKIKLRETGNVIYVYDEGYAGYEAEQLKHTLKKYEGQPVYRRVKARPFKFNSYINSLLEGCFKKW